MTISPSPVTRSPPSLRGKHRPQSADRPPQGGATSAHLGNFQSALLGSFHPALTRASASTDGVQFRQAAAATVRVFATRRRSDHSGSAGRPGHALPGSLLGSSRRLAITPCARWRRRRYAALGRWLFRLQPCRASSQQRPSRVGGLHLPRHPAAHVCRATGDAHLCATRRHDLNTAVRRGGRPICCGFMRSKESLLTFGMAATCERGNAILTARCGPWPRQWNPDATPASQPSDALRLRVAAAFFAAADRAAAGLEADAAPPSRPPLRDGAWFSGFPRPLPLFLPPPVSLLTVAQARRSASSLGTPRCS
jgi:hypothetical protein